ncbi:MAG: 30S ribosomal protein S2 [Patescibacteria group bacterium]
MLAEKNKLEEMTKAGMHFGYSRSRRHPRMSPYIFGARNNIEIFDLDKTVQKLEEAKNFVRNLGRENRKILFVGTKIEAKKIIEEFSKTIDMPFVSERWLGGILTNFKVIRNRMNYMDDLIKKRESGELNKYTKQERLKIEKEISDLKRNFGGLGKWESLPAALIIVDSKEEKNAIAEAKKVSIPIIAIVNSDCNPEDADYPIPANDNSLSSIQYIISELTDAYKEGLKDQAKEKNE